LFKFTLELRPQFLTQSLDFHCVLKGSYAVLLSMFKFFPAVSKTAWTVYHATRAYVNCQFFLFSLSAFLGRNVRLTCLLSIVNRQFLPGFAPLPFVTALLVYHNNINLSIPFFKKNGAQTRNRTTDTEIFSLLLYQLSYLGTVGLQGLEPWTYRL
jgi:hypothetical protein